VIRTSFRLPFTMIQRLDALTARLRRQKPIGNVSRADVLRMLVEVGLARSERRPKKPSRR
jgi:predicted DNA-binding protein